VDAAAAAYADDVRVRTNQLTAPEADSMFAHVYSEQHPLVDQQRKWLADYEASFEEGRA
jgi:pyruvate dehydrogenase E1 component alpha subunit